MTNDEIEKEMRDTLDLLRYDVEDKELIQAVLDSTRNLVVQAYEESAKQVCDACASGNPAERGKADDDYPFLHRYSDAVFPCRADKVHALKDSLVETVPSN